MARRKDPEARTTRSQAKPPAAPVQLERWLLQKEVWGLILTAFGAVTLISLLTPNQGKLSAAWSLLLRQGFGLGAYVIALLLTVAGIFLLLSNAMRRRRAARWQAIVGWEIVFFAGLGLLHFSIEGSYWQAALRGERGGYLGWALAQMLDLLLGKTLGLAILWAFILLGIYLIAGVPLALMLWRMRWLFANVGLRLRARLARLSPAKPVSAVPQVRPAQRVSTPSKSAPIAQPATPTGAAARPKKPQRPTNKAAPKPPPPRVAPGLPSLELLVPDLADDGDDADARAKAEIIEETLSAFGVPARVVEWHRGPVVTQFGVEPGYVESKDREGATRRFKIRVSKILSLTNDLALALAAAPIRIEAPVPGRAMVGIEVPNGHKSMVGLRGVLESAQFRKMRARLKFALGRDVSGEAVVTDLAKMPHLLIAGATGSGKSVCLNALIASLLCECLPDQIKLLLIDPKRVELTKYNGVPHLIAPVVVDLEKVIMSLRWVTREMDHRYKVFAETGARDLASYNRIAPKKGLEPMPMIVVVIDELADLMLSAPDDVERTICRLAQMARATGIHMVIATQRPSVDVVTGLIKANFPARISFAVTSQVDSRVILDTPGAEKLLGRGDMLFMAPDSPKLQRIQGCFVSDKEVDDMVAFWRRQVPSSEEAEPDEPPWEEMDMDDAEVDDRILQQAIELVRQHRQASASFLQRHLRIGYPRAGRLMDQLEEMGIVGPPEKGGRSRIVLGVPDGGDAETEETEP
jgi:S-DNA-T family DNA segregation ATPase FtsK/SpoIIIE